MPPQIEVLHRQHLFSARSEDVTADLESQVAALR